MINLRFLFLITFISFSVNDDHCFGKFKICPSDIPTNTITGSIDHCFEYEYDDEDNSDRVVCSFCNFGYALSYDQMSCIAYKNCVQLDEGNTICEYCYPGYYLSGKECKKIQISHCEEMEEENVCGRCAEYAILNEGQCIIPTTTIEGCREYKPDGSCSYCGGDYEETNDGCQFLGCGNGETPIEYCEYCEVGYITDNKDGKCKAYSEFKDSSRGNKIKAANALLLIILAFLI